MTRPGKQLTRQEAGALAIEDAGRDCIKQRLAVSDQTLWHWANKGVPPGRVVPLLLLALERGPCRVTPHQVCPAAFPDDPRTAILFAPRKRRGRHAA